VKRPVVRLRGEEGIAMVLVVFAFALLATLSVILIDTVTSESARSAKAVKTQTSYEAAESGLNDYIAKLTDDRVYYQHWVHPAESTRRDNGVGGTNALASASGSSPAPSSWCRDPKLKPAPLAWIYDATWDYPNGKDHWCSLGNGFEYNLQVTPPSATQTGVTIVSTGRRISDPTDTRIIEAVVRQSSITDFQEIADGPIGWGAGATSYGLIYANGDITWNSSGTIAYGSNFANGKLIGPATWGPAATGFDANTSTAYTNLFSPPSPLKQAIDFNTFTTSFSDIASAAGDSTGGGIYLDSSYNSWRLTFNSDGTVTVEGCTGASPEVTQPACVAVAPSPRSVPTNGAIYSEVNVIVRGTVKGRVTVATPNEVIVGGNILYEGDGSFTTPVFGKNVLGLAAVKDVVVPCWVMGDLDWRAAVLAQGVGKTYRAWSTGCSSNLTGITDCSSASATKMRHRGSAAVATGGSFSGKFDCRDYLYDDELTYLAPPWFPTIDPNYAIISFRELPAP
jgi:hypothetical protein